MVASTSNLDVSLQKISLFQEGSYKSILELSSQAEQLSFEVDGVGLEEDGNGKVWVREWTMDGIATNHIINYNDENNLKIYLDRKSLSSAIYLHAVVMKFDENLMDSNGDGFVPFCHGKVLLYPRKRLFDPNQNIVQSEHKVKLKLASLLKQEMVQVVQGWMEFSVNVNIDVRSDNINLSIVDEESFQLPEPVIHEEGDEEVNDKNIHQDQDQTASPKIHPKLANLKKQTLENRTESPPVGIGIEKSYFDLPDMNAVRDILPKYHELSTKQQQTQQLPRDRKSSVQPHVPIEEPDQSEFDDLFKSSNQKPNNGTPMRGGANEILVYQAQEIEKYRSIVETMGKDINLLHKQVAHLKHDKSQLSYQLTLASTEQMAPQNENSVIVQLKHQMVSQNTDKLELQERVTNLQNQIIKKNEVEENFLKLQTAHEEQQRLIHEYQNKLTKLKRLEQLVTEQENVIQVMEKKLKKTNGTQQASAQSPRCIETTNRGTPPKKADPSIAKVTESIEKIDHTLGVIYELDEAYSTIKALREQIEANSREIGHERAYMMNKPMYHYTSAPKSYPVFPVEHDLPTTLPTYWRPGDEPTSYNAFAKYSYNHPMGRSMRRNQYPF